MTIGSISSFVSNVDNYIMKNGTDMPSASPAAHVALTLVALLPVVSLIYKVRITQQLEQKLLPMVPGFMQAKNLSEQIDASEQYESFEIHFNRCAIVGSLALAILFPQTQVIRVVRKALVSVCLYGLYKTFQLRNKTVFNTGNGSFTLRMARVI